MRADRGALVVGIACLAATAALLVAAVLRPPLPLPVQLVIEHRRIPLAIMSGTFAALVPLALVGVAALVRGVRGSAAAPLWALGAAAPILLVVVARLNDAVDAPVLVLEYAATAGAVLLRLVAQRDRSLLALRLAAVLGVVPWGVVALEQVGGLLAGVGPEPAVRVLTVVVLLASVAEYVVAYRRRERPLSDAGALLLVAAGPLLAAVLVVVAV